MGCAEFMGFGELGVVNVYGDHGVRAGEVGTEDGAQADAADADDDDSFTDGHTGVAGDGAKAGGNRVGEKRCDFEIGIGGDLSDAVFRNDSEILKCGDIAGVDGLRAEPVFRRRGLDARAGPPMEHDVVTGFDVGNLGANLDDDATAFVAEAVERIEYEPARTAALAWAERRLELVAAS